MANERLVKKVLNVIVYAVTNATYVGILVFAARTGNVVATDTIVVMTAVLLYITIPIALTSYVSVRWRYFDRLGVSANVDHAVDAVILLFLFELGFYATAAMYAVHLICLLRGASLYAQEVDLRKASKEHEAHS